MPAPDGVAVLLRTKQRLAFGGWRGPGLADSTLKEQLIGAPGAPGAAYAAPDDRLFVELNHHTPP